MGFFIGLFIALILLSIALQEQAKSEGKKDVAEGFRGMFAFLIFLVMLAIFFTLFLF